MAVTRVNQSSATPTYFPSTSDTVTIPVPSGYQADDIVVAFVNRGSNTGDIAAPDGSWTRINTAGSWGFTYSSVDVETDAFWKVMTGSEGTNYAFDAIDSTTGGGGCVVLRGANTTTPISVAAVYTLAEGAGNGGSDITVGPATSTDDGSYLIGMVSTWDGVGFGSWSGENVTLTELWDDDSNGYTGAVGGPLASAGSSGTWANSLTYNADTDYPFFTIMIVVDPASSTEEGVGSIAGVGAATGIGTGIIASAGSSAGSGAASGVGAASTVFAGSSAGSGAASGVGASNAASAGSAAGTGSASGVGAPILVAVGSAAGSSAATAVGTGINTAGAGAAAGTSTASGGGGSIVPCAGTASGTSSCIAQAGGMRNFGTGALLGWDLKR